MGVERWMLVGMYLNAGTQEKSEDMREFMKENEEGIELIIGRYFNARTGDEGGIKWVAD